MTRITITDEMIERAVKAYAEVKKAEDNQQYIIGYILRMALGPHLERRTTARRIADANPRTTNHTIFGHTPAGAEEFIFGESLSAEPEITQAMLDAGHDAYCKAAGYIRLHNPSHLVAAYRAMEKARREQK
jgi:hypothetical protein